MNKHILVYLYNRIIFSKTNKKPKKEWYLNIQSTRKNVKTIILRNKIDIKHKHLCFHLYETLEKPVLIYSNNKYMHTHI